MLECMVEWMTSPLYYAYNGAPPPPRAGAAHATIYPYGPFPAGDGKIVMLGLQNEREWVVFCDKVLKQPALAAEPRFAGGAARNAAREELRKIIVAAFAPLTAAEVVERLDAAQIANARLNSLEEVWQHAQLRARGRWVQVDTAVGKIPAPIPPGLPDGFEVRLGPVPTVGEHTESILAEIGFGAEALAALRAEGAV
jgi:itaconate CoA-transferase